MGEVWALVLETVSDRVSAVGMGKVTEGTLGKVASGPEFHNHNILMMCSCFPCI